MSGVTVPNVTMLNSVWNLCEGRQVADDGYTAQRSDVHVQQRRGECFNA